MKNIIHNIIFKFFRFCVRCLTPHFHVYDSNNLNEPAVYIVHHQNLHGPIICMTWLNKSIRPWVLSAFCKRSACFEQYYKYTFKKRICMKNVVAGIIAYPLSFCVAGLMQLIQAIPVFRSSKNIIKTFKQSVSALMKDQSILIAPDINYLDEESNMGEMYKGFLNLDKYYQKQTGKHIAFIPLHIDKSSNCIRIGKAIYFKEGNNFKNERLKVYHKLRQEFLRLEKQNDEQYYNNKKGFPDTIA